MGEKALVRMKTRAQVRLAGRPQIRAGYAFPQQRREIYFDIEDDPTRDLTYLFGLVTRDKEGRGDFRYFLARTPQQEENAVREFWEFVRETDDAVFYVYSAKERATLKRLMKRYGLDETVYDRYLEREYDLYSDLVVKYSDWPTYSYGIKQIAGLVGFKWRDPDPSGANSIVWYNEYLSSGSPQLLERILDYNEDDCRAMMAVKDHFASHTLASAAVPVAG
jgi:uncharacterized protein